MFEGLNHITLSGEGYPIKCDLLVLEKIQNKYGTVDEFERLISTWEKDEEGNLAAKVPESIEAVGDALSWMVNEGEQIEAEEKKREAAIHSREHLIRKNDMNIWELANALKKEFISCFKVKNVETTQNQTEGTKNHKS